LSRNPLPSLQTQVHNTNFLGAAVLYRANKYSGEKRFIAPALKVARYSAQKQRDGGSWVVRGRAMVRGRATLRY